MNKKGRWKLGLGGTLLIAALALVARPLVSARGSKPIDPSLVVTLARTDLDVLVTETGKVEPKLHAEIKSRVAGQALQVAVREGDAVHVGQKLIQLDPIDYQRDVERAAAELEQESQQLAFSEGQLARRERALEGRGISQADYENVKNEAAVARAKVQLGRVTLASARDRLRYTTITSPMDGVVIQRNIEPGEAVIPGATATFDGKPLLVVADLRALKVTVKLNQIDVAKVHRDQEVDVTVDALPGKSFRARVTKVAPASIAEKGKDVETFPVEATLIGDSGEIKPGMTADVKIRVDRKQGALVLPIEAVATERGKQFGREIGAEKHFVQVLKGALPGAATERLQVEIGERNDREIEITKGLSEGQKVLIQPPPTQNEIRM